MKSEQIGDATLYTGDVLEVLRSLPSESAHCIVTSPPYWGLRDYGIEPSVWDGDPGCAHEWGEEGSRQTHGAQGNSSTMHTAPVDGVNRSTEIRTGAFCRLCGAWRGAHGLEPTPELYVAHEVAIWREARRVLRKDGTAWCNLGDSYASTGRSDRKESPGVGAKQEMAAPGRTLTWKAGGGSNFSWSIPSFGTQIKPKDLVGIPWRVAFALQADGWYLRSDIIWHKPNPMPESVTDRPTKAHEYIFLLSKSARYFYDAEAIKEAAIHAGETVVLGEKSLSRGQAAGAGIEPSGNGKASSVVVASGRNRRSVWTVATAPYKEAHFATFPPKLIEPCILAGCPEHVCPKCGAPWVREVEKSGGTIGHSWHDHARDSEAGSSQMVASITDQERSPYVVRTIGEHPTCACGLPAIGGTVLDPFGGSGTTAAVALEYGRRAILIERKPEYVDLQRKRLRPVAGRPLLAFG